MHFYRSSMYWCHLSVNAWCSGTAVRRDIHRDVMMSRFREPLMGKTYQLSNLKNIKMQRFENGDIISCIETKDGKKVKLKLTGEYASAWAAKLIHIRGASAGHHSHPNKVFVKEEVKLASDARTFISAPSSSPRSSSNHSKFSYAITLDDYSDSLDKVAEGTDSSENSGTTRLRGDIPSVLEPPESGRAMGGKVQEDSCVTELVHSLLTKSSSRSSNRREIQDQLDALIRRHMRDEEERQKCMDLPPA